MLNIHNYPPLSLYIHLPWCIKKCPYCDFNSHAVDRQDLTEGAYINALIKDLETELPQIQERPITSIFIGGGTPSLFSGDAIARLMHHLSEQLIFPQDIEITIEANPNSAEATRFKAYRQSGINRISIGIQSFDDKKLTLLGRTHDHHEAINAIKLAKDAGFKEINIDLMFGLPEQTIAEAIADLEIAIAQQPSHISWYQLTIEPNTAFYSKPPPLPDDDSLWQIQQQGQIYLASHQFHQYEISAYAHRTELNTGHQCQHNLNYWKFGDYLGIGAGAHSKLTDLGQRKINRYARHRIPQSYIDKINRRESVKTVYTLTKNVLPLEFMMNALRLKQGFHSVLFTERTSLPLEQIHQQLTTARQKNWLEWQAHKIKPTASGQQYLNDVLQLFMPD